MPRRNVEFDGHFVHGTHPRAAALGRNASFEQLPAKCTHSGRLRLRGLYNRSLGDYPRRCDGHGYFTVAKASMCCAWEGHDWRSTRYGPPTSRWVAVGGPGGTARDPDAGRWPDPGPGAALPPVVAGPSAHGRRG